MPCVLLVRKAEYTLLPLFSNLETTVTYLFLGCKHKKQQQPVPSKRTLSFIYIHFLNFSLFLIESYPITQNMFITIQAIRIFLVDDLFNSYVTILVHIRFLVRFLYILHQQDVLTSLSISNLNKIILYAGNLVIVFHLRTTVPQKEINIQKTVMHTMKVRITVVLLSNRMRTNAHNSFYYLYFYKN